MYANDHVSTLAHAVTAHLRRDSTAEITGAVVSMMPHIVEKAILTNPTLPGDVSARISAHFTPEFEAVAKIICNAGGFSNPIKKTLFNASVVSLK